MAELRLSAFDESLAWIDVAWGISAAENALKGGWWRVRVS